MPAALAAQGGDDATAFVCPMDRNVRSAVPGRCPKCGMALVPGIVEFAEYPGTVRSAPAVPRAGERVRLSFTVQHPRTGAKVTAFDEVHEKLFHLFAVSEDLSFFLHDHPRFERGAFYLDAVLPKAGMYRMLSDFYPRGGSPQLVASTVVVASVGSGAGAVAADLSPKAGTNLQVSLAMEPSRPVAGMKTMLFFRVEPAAGLEQYLGAWGHVLAASADLVDMIHSHPYLADGGPQVQFNLIFPRPGMHRVWVQFQRLGVVNTVHFDIPVVELK